MSTCWLSLLVLASLFSNALAQEPPPPNATACTVGVSKCDGSEQNCICQHAGICQGPSFTSCQCPSADTWTGTYCHLALCVGANFPNGCVNGFCKTPGECACNQGWKGFDCTIPLPCTPGVSQCTGACACLNGGTCGGPQNTVCTCPTGYASDYCEVVVCNGPDFPGGCQHGKCVSPNVCVCNPGWNGTDCSKAICDPPCAHGKCTAPNTCDCAGTGFAHCPGGPEICGCDENECQRGERPCDPLVTCTNFEGGFNCSACPPGYPGQPYLTYPLSPANKTYFEGGCATPVGTTAPPTTASPTSAVSTTGVLASTAAAPTSAATQASATAATAASSSQVVATTAVATAVATTASSTSGQATTGAAASSSARSSAGSSSQQAISSTIQAQESSEQMMSSTSTVAPLIVGIGAALAACL